MSQKTQNTLQPVVMATADHPTGIHSAIDTMSADVLRLQEAFAQLGIGLSDESLVFATHCARLNPPTHQANSVLAAVAEGLGLVYEVTGRLAGELPPEDQSASSESTASTSLP